MALEQKALICDIQRFCTHDGPGVRTVIFFKGCPLHCPWCSNPESIGTSPELYYIKNKCIGCGECIKVCPQDCIFPAEPLAAGEKKTIVIDRSKCVSCFSCVKECPTMALIAKGERRSITDLMEKALADKVFFDESGGGITLSGGEVMLQASAAEALLKSAKEEKLHTAIETSGYGKSETLDRLLRYCDLVFFDVKMVNRERHKKMTGQSNDLIIFNLRKVAEEKKSLIVRLPMIPGYNMDDDNVRDVIDLLAPLDIPVEPLLFHQLGKNKYVSLGKDYALEQAETLHHKSAENIIKKLVQAGIKTIFP
jgi:pyruvate formate lyase activating enzyme